MTTDYQHILSLCSRTNTLRVTFPDKSGDASELDDFYFNRAKEESIAISTDEEVHVVVQKTIHDRDHSTVYLGLLGNVAVALKGCYNPTFYKDMKKEARAYRTCLRALQGRVVPTYFGYYKAVDQEFGPHCLILMEFCGESVETIFEDLDRQEQCALILSHYHPCNTDDPEGSRS